MIDPPHPFGGPDALAEGKWGPRGGCPQCASLYTPVSPAIPDPYSAKGPPLPIDPCPVSGPMAGIVSPVVQDELHTQPFVTVHDKLRAEGHDLDVDDLNDCPACQTTRTTTRGFTYDLATLLGEGHYEEEPQP